MKLLLVLVIIISSLSLYGQKDTTRRCSEVINELSYFWKLDSTAANGFRLYTYKRIIDSKLDFLPVDTLLAKLGKPNQILKSQKDVTYIYYFLNALKVPSEAKLPYELLYIGFIQKNGESFINRVTNWFIDL